MLEYLRMRNAPAFDAATGVDIGPLKPVNFLFGPNGSGKTTVSRALADPSRFAGTTLEWCSSPGVLGVKVYNRDYVNDTLTAAGHLPGVFLLGKASVEIQAELDELTGVSGSIATAQDAVTRDETSLAKKIRDVAAVRDELRNAAWARRASVPAELGEMFTGYNNNKEKLLDRLLEVAEAFPTAPEGFDALKAEAAAVLAENAQPTTELPLSRPIRLEDAPGFDLLGIPVVGSAAVQLAPLIQQLQNADWVQRGRHYLDQTGGLCPYCQQGIPAGLAEQLDAYFDGRYTQQVDQLKALQQHVLGWAAGWRIYLDELLTKAGVSEHLNVDRLQTARLQLEQVLTQLDTAIASKISSPAAVVTVPDPAPEVGEIIAIVSEANTSIRTFNLRLKNRAAAKKALLDRCWVVFARATLAAEVGRYEGAMPGHLAGKLRIEERKATSEADLQAKRERLREVQAMVTSSKPIIETINRLLISVGFHSFRLAESTAVSDGYSLVRANGDVAAETLSEGERTFITFLYFLQSLQGASQDEAELDDLVAVIDDPISSLDSDVLYAVSTLVRRLVADIAAGTGRVRQMVLMTHNAHFHKEVTYRRRGDKLGSWQYGIVRKRSGHSSEVALSSDNPIQTAYGALWDEVKRSSEQPAASAAGLQNILRRILETYFRVLGGVDDPTIVAKFQGGDQAICRSLFAWVNAGSHSIFDDLDYSSTPATVEANLLVFRRIFEEQGQLGHYLMMMSEPTSSAARL